MKLHKEGFRAVAVTGFLVLLMAFGGYLLFPGPHGWAWVFYLFLLMVFAGVVYFFRSPNRQLLSDSTRLVSPADGTVVVVEQTMEEEYFGQPVQQVSVFMSPLNVHLNRYPADARVVLCRYHPGSFLVAWHPKSSLLNDRMTVVFETPGGWRFMLRQIAGAVARRIVCYCREGLDVKQGDELGFIKFGSRVDLLLPPGATVCVKPGDKVRAGVTVIASLQAVHKKAFSSSSLPIR